MLYKNQSCRCVLCFVKPATSFNKLSPERNVFIATGDLCEGSVEKVGATPLAPEALSFPSHTTQIVLKTPHTYESLVDHFGSRWVC